jgi:hypothetical protein
MPPHTGDRSYDESATIAPYTVWLGWRNEPDGRDGRRWELERTQLLLPLGNAGYVADGLCNPSSLLYL